MKREERLVFLLDGIADEFLVQAFETDNAEKFKRYSGTHRRQIIFRAVLAAAACLCLILLTPPGKVAAMNLYKGVQTWFEMLIPAQKTSANLGKATDSLQEQLETIVERVAESVEITVWLEGFPETVEHSLYGVMPGDEYKTGFNLYVDTEHYTFSEEDGIYTVRPQEFADWMSPCYMEIRQLADITGEEASEAAALQLSESYGDVWEIQETEVPTGLYIYAQDGLDWDAPVVEMWFIEDGMGNVYVISSHYFMEATEGHGTRFAVMVSTFEVLH